MSKNTNIAELGKWFSDMFTRRISNPDTYEPLLVSEPYQTAIKEFDKIEQIVFNEKLSKHFEKNELQKMFSDFTSAKNRLNDLHQEYFYRLGLQDGVNLKTPAFLTESI